MRAASQLVCGPGPLVAGGSMSENGARLLLHASHAEALTLILAQRVLQHVLLLSGLHKDVTAVPLCDGKLDL